MSTRKTVPNVIILLTDALRFDRVNQKVMPNVTRIAQENGIFYTNVTSPDSHTQTVMPFYLCGRQHYDPKCGLPQFLSEIGYRTILINTNVVVKLFFEKGWSEVHYLPRFSLAKTESIRHRLQPVLSRWLPLQLFIGIQNIYKYFSYQLPYCPSEKLLDFACTILQRTSSPYFIWIHLMDAHEPYFPVTSKIPTPILKWYVLLNYNYRANRRLLSDKELRMLRMLYTLNVMEMDTAIGKFYNRIMDDNTIIVILSDHGECLGENGILGHEKYTHVPALLRIPLIVVGKGAAVVQDRISLIDLPSMIYDLIGINK